MVDVATPKLSRYNTRRTSAAWTPLIISGISNWGDRRRYEQITDRWTGGSLAKRLDGKMKFNRRAGRGDVGRRLCGMKNFRREAGRILEKVGRSIWTKIAQEIAENISKKVSHSIARIIRRLGVACIIGSNNRWRGTSSPPGAGVPEGGISRRGVSRKISRAGSIVSITITITNEADPESYLHPR